MSGLWMIIIICIVVFIVIVVDELPDMYFVDLLLN